MPAGENRRPFERKRPVVVVHMQWRRWFPIRGSHGRFWHEVAKEVRAKGVRATDRKKIIGVCCFVEARMVKAGRLRPRKQ